MKKTREPTESEITSQILYCSIPDKIFEYYTRQGGYYLFDGVLETKVNPMSIFIAVGIDKTAVFLNNNLCETSPETYEFYTSDFCLRDLKEYGWPPKMINERNSYYKHKIKITIEE